MSHRRSLTFGMRRARGFFSWLIRWFGAGDFSHVDMRDEQGWWWGARFGEIFADGKWWPRGFHRRPPDYCKDELWLFTIQVTEEEYHRFWDVVRHELEGLPYDWMAILAFAFPRLAMRRDWRKLKQTICSEAATYACEKAGIFERLYKRVAKVTPGDFAIMLCARKAIYALVRPLKAAA